MSESEQGTSATIRTDDPTGPQHVATLQKGYKDARTTTEDGGNRDVLADGLMSLLLPAAKQLDESATLVAQSQLRLVSEIDRLNTELDKFFDAQKIPTDYEPELKKLSVLRQRVANLNSQLLAIQERVNRTTAGLTGDTKKKGWTFGF